MKKDLKNILRNLEPKPKFRSEAKYMTEKALVRILDAASFFLKDALFMMKAEMLLHRVIPGQTPH